MTAPDAEVERAPVVIIGAGAAGLAAAAELQRRDIRSVVLEASDAIGSSWATRYERLHLHTHRLLSGLPGRRVPRAAGRYPSKDAYAAYLADYAAALGLDVRLGCAATSVTPAVGATGFAVSTPAARLRARAVVVATGLYGTPLLPHWPGAEELGARLTHASAYRSGSAHAGTRVLVVGVGNTGAELATDLVEQGAAHVSVAVRTVPPISPRDIAGVPSQLFGLALSSVPPTWADGLQSGLRRLGPDLRPYGLAPPGWGAFGDHRPPVIDVGFVQQVRAGMLEVRPALSHFDGGDAVFADGSRARFDAVVAATGYTPGLTQLLAELPDALRGDGTPASGATHGLHFLGFTPTLRGQLLEINRGARRLARTLARELGDVEEPGGE
ncbi:MAG: monooxygenase [Thermoleophilia bacterium]|nr:monooxygenase [Thermoleophilia bacterium]